MDELEVSRIDIILIFQAYNKREISYEEFIRLVREWAEAMVKRYEPQPSPVMPD